MPTRCPAWSISAARSTRIVVLEISPDGKVVDEISMPTAPWRDMAGVLQRTTDCHDPTHLNDVEEVTPEFAAAFPQSKAGDLIVSLRNLNAVAGIDRQTKRATGSWSGRGSSSTMSTCCRGA